MEHLQTTPIEELEKLEAERWDTMDKLNELNLSIAALKNQLKRNGDVN